MGLIVTKGYVERWFNVDWSTIQQLRNAVAIYHDEIIDALLSLKNAKEANSGHSGFNVCFVNEKRSDKAIEKSIVKTINAVCDK